MRALTLQERLVDAIDRGIAEGMGRPVPCPGGVELAAGFVARPVGRYTDPDLLGAATLFCWLWSHWSPIRVPRRGGRQRLSGRAPADRRTRLTNPDGSIGRLADRFSRERGVSFSTARRWLAALAELGIIAKLEPTVTITPSGAVRRTIHPWLWTGSFAEGCGRLEAAGLSIAR